MEWTRTSPKFSIGPRFSHASCTVEKAIYFFGGQRKGYMADVWCWDAAGDEWSSLTPAGNGPAARAQHTAVFTGKEGIIFGGYCDNVAEVNDLYAIDLLQPEREFTWSNPSVRGNPPEARYGHSATMVNDHMVIVAGQTSTSQLCDVWVLHAPTYAWSEVAAGGAHFIPRMLHSATAIGDNVYILGGFNRRSRCLCEVFALGLSEDKEKGTWRQVPVENAEEVFGTRSQHGAVAVGNTILIHGGYNGAGRRARPNA